MEKIIYVDRFLSGQYEIDHPKHIISKRPEDNTFVIHNTRKIQTIIYLQYKMFVTSLPD